MLAIIFGIISIIIGLILLGVGILVLCCRVLNFKVPLPLAVIAFFLGKLHS